MGGPPFLKQKEIYTEQDKSESFVDTSEIKNATKILIAPSSKSSNVNEVIQIQNYGRYQNLLRVTAWIWRFITNLNAKRKVNKPRLSSHLQTN